MLDKPISPLRQRMIDDMTARRFKEKVQKDSASAIGTRSDAQSSIPSLGDGVMLGTARLDRRVERRAGTPGRRVINQCCMDVPPCPSRFALACLPSPPRGFAGTA
jgi:hypothetical protein